MKAIHPTRLKHGLTLVEVLVAIAILGIGAAALIAFLPFVTRVSNDTSVDLTQTQEVVSILETIDAAWDLPSNYSFQSGGANVGAVEVNGAKVSVPDFVSTRTGGECSATIVEVDAIRKRVIISCAATGDLPQRVLRREYGDPLSE
ncbi:MAG: prepilin-type N-terminal cleavage/methylation domain-containing protein [Phycisphaerales bacterium JB060]